MPIEVDEFKKTADEISADGKITADESDKTISALKLALSIMKQQEERETELKADYEDKLKQKDAQIVKIGSLIAGGLFGQQMVQFWIFGVPIEKLGMSGLLFLCGFLVTMGAMWIKNAFPSLFTKLRTSADIIMPLIDPQIKAGLDTVGKLIDSATKPAETPKEVPKDGN